MATSDRKPRTRGKRGPYATSLSLLAAACRRRLKQKVNPDDKESKLNFADQVSDALITIALKKEEVSFALQAIKILIQLEDRVRLANPPNENRNSDPYADLRNKTDEELDAEIEELRASLEPLLAKDGQESTPAQPQGEIS